MGKMVLSFNVGFEDSDVDNFKSGISFPICLIIIMSPDYFNRGNLKYVRIQLTDELIDQMTRYHVKSRARNQLICTCMFFFTSAKASLLEVVFVRLSVGHVLASKSTLRTFWPSWSLFFRFLVHSFFFTWAFMLAFLFLSSSRKKKKGQKSGHFDASKRDISYGRYCQLVLSNFKWGLIMHYPWPYMSVVKDAISFPLIFRSFGFSWALAWVPFAVYCLATLVFLLTSKKRMGTDIDADVVIDG